MAPPTTDTADALFWKAYGAGVQKAIGNVTVNDTTSFYLSTKSQRGPPGGDDIAESFTNEGLYNFGNNLLPPDQLFYSPSSLNSYIDQLQTYLAWVDVGGTPSSANVQQVTNTRNAMEAAHEGQSKALKSALADYADQKSAGLVGEQTFAQWAPSNAPAYIAIVQEYKSKTAQFQKAYKNAYGALADIKLADEAKLMKAADTVTAQPGFNMPCTMGSPPSAAEINNAVSAGKKLKDPNTILRPAFESQGYVSAIKDAQALVGSDAPSKASFTVKSAQGGEVQESSFNKSAVSGGVSFSYWPWVSFSAHGGSETEDSSFSTASFADALTITVNYDSIDLVSINPSGSWDLGDVRSKYKKLLPGAPESVKVLVKPTQLVLATRLGYTIDVDASARSSFDTLHKHASSGGGSVSIFGIPCSFSADASSSDGSTTHRANWDSTNGKFTVLPTDNCGFASVIGLIGEKLNVTA